MTGVRMAVQSWLLYPVYVWQGLGLRRRIERMPPPPGPCQGHLGSGEPEIRLLVLGDSSAAGVGVATMEESLAARLAERLSVLSGRAVSWSSRGANSATSAEVRDFVVPNLDREPFTHILLSIGTNDVKNWHSARRFKRSFGTLLYALRARWPEARIVWSPPVDMRRVPALPRGLARVLALRAALLERLGRRLCIERGIVPATTLPRVEPAGFSRDGFHASAEGAAYTAGHLAGFILPERLAGA
ncbi:SGNH/GDSL hydrolase family protein [Aureimonas sp. AU4]|uniref:SGNH/GDSL hydrolase family protein n=1 Tax=Aureimonas sp. AU4 TaxID=1638163 RepID=UPI0012E39812|nr:SGNH/GDSL hydrolase family protein [Aureimonas sp. AU4]